METFVFINAEITRKVAIWVRIPRLEYEGLHSICFKCGRFGHKKEQCREQLSDNVQGEIPRG
jgi:hypothetical protein